MDTSQAGFQPLRFSTADLPERDRVPAWRDFFGPSVFRVEIDPAADRPFFAEMIARQLPDITLTSSTTSPARFSRTPSLAAHNGDGIDLFINSSGGIAWQAGREIEVGRGEAYLMDAAEAGGFSSPAAERSHCFHVRMPRAVVAPLTDRVNDSILKPIPPGSDALRYMINYVRIMLTDRTLANPGLAGAAASHLRDLLALVLGATRDGAVVAERRGLRAARLAAIKRFIEGNPGDRSLNVDAIAARHGLTPRTVQRMFEAEGTTFSDYVLECRLMTAYRMLDDARYAHWTVNAIALEAGFGDLSYFNRCFRRRFGASPTACRNIAGQF